MSAEVKKVLCEMALHRVEAQLLVPKTTNPLVCLLVFASVLYFFCSDQGCQLLQSKMSHYFLICLERGFVHSVPDLDPMSPGQVLLEP